MDAYQAIQARWNFIIPQDYRGMQQAGFFDHSNQRHVGLSDVEWFGLDEISGYEPLGFQIGGLVPFAMEARASTWAWMRDKQMNGTTPVAHCPRDSEVATVFAPDFTGALYRLILEDLRSTWLIGRDGIAGPDDATRLFRRYARDLTPYFPSGWVSRLDELLKRPFREMADECIGVMGGPELTAILKEDLRFPLLEAEFHHYVPEESALPEHLSGYFRSYQIFASQFTPADLLDPVDLGSLHLTDPMPVVEPQTTRSRFTLTWQTPIGAAPIYLNYYAKTYFNPAKLKPLNLISPCSVSATVPIESSKFFINYLRVIGHRRAFYIYVGEELVPLATFCDQNGSE